MATITSLGIGSGLDLNTIVTQLVALERRPLGAMQSQASRLQTQVSSFGRMSGLFGTLQSAANKLADPGLWSQSRLSSSDPAVVTATALSGASAANGSYALTVQALARDQNVVSVAAASAGELAGVGKLTIDIGTWDVAGTTLTKSGEQSVQIAVLPGDTLASLRDKINISGANVTATLVTDTSGVRLALRSNASGLENAFRIRVVDGNKLEDGAGLLSRFAYNGAADTRVGRMQLTQAAANAAATVNGIAVQSSTNQLTGVVDGLTLNLGRVSADEVIVSASADREAVGSAIKTFSDAYNSLVSYIKEQTRYDAATKVAGTLQGDSAVNGIQTSLRNLLGATSGASSAFTRLSDIGLQATRDGTLEVNQGQLDQALGDLPELKRAFGASDALNPANNGFARRYALLATQVLGTDGSLKTRTEGLRKLISKNSDDQERLNTRVEKYQQRLVAQYTAMDSNLSRLNSLSGLVTQQLAALNRNTRN